MDDINLEDNAQGRRAASNHASVFPSGDNLNGAQPRPDGLDPPVAEGPPPVPGQLK